MSSEAISFLRQVVAEDSGTYFNVHRRVLIPADGRIIIPGNAHQRIRPMIEDASYWAQRGNDTYLAQGRYRNCGPSGHKGPYPAAIRQQSNLISCKNLYMDVDVKDGGYASTNDALRALKAFIHSTDLPEPTIIVGSGNGGLHLYWTLSIDFEPREFRLMASQLTAAGIKTGLLFDSQCTNDPCRLLRIPGTWNFKNATDEAPAPPVTLMHNSQTYIDLELMREALKDFKAPPRVSPRGNTSSQSKPNFRASNIDEVAKDCPFIRETLETGGANLVGEPQWHLAAALSCHTDDPHKTVHRLCEKSPHYGYEGTEDKLAQAQQQRDNRETIGPPKCDYIQQLNIPHCATCPHLALGTTPLALKYKQPNSYAAFTSTPNANPNSLDLPERYWRGSGDLIYTISVDEDGNEVDTVAFEYQILPNSGSMEAGVPFTFTIDTVQGERQVTKRFPCAITAHNNAFAEAFHAAGLPLTTDIKVTRGLFVNYLKQLQDKKETLIAVPAFGWSLDHVNELGFAYAGKFFSPAGEFKATRAADGAADYRVQGDASIWSGLMNIILTPERPDLACMVASSFGAPLVGMTGENGLLLGLWSTQSGIGKSTALVAAQAVWSKPVIGGLSDTINYTFAKCATLRHLPIYYDEIKGEKQIRSAVELVFQLTGGKEKGRSGRGGEMRAVREFETLCAYASNSSLVESVREHHQGTDASWLRMFEMQAITKPNEEINFTNEVRERLTQLRLNYGGIGMKYAEFLGNNQVKLSKALLKYQIDLAKELGADPQVHRFWLAAMSTTMLGAWCANHLKLCAFPLDEMRAFLISEYRRMQQEMTENPSDLSTDTALRNAIGSFINEKAPRNLIILDKTWTAKSKPPKDYAKVLNDKNEAGWGILEVQVSGDPLVLRISDTALGAWCAKTKYPKNALVEQLKKKLGARMSMATLGSGSYKAGASQNLLILDAKNTMLEEMLEYGISHKFLPP